MERGPGGRGRMAFAKPDNTKGAINRMLAYLKPYRVHLVFIGIGIVIFSVLLAVTIYTENDIFVLIGTAGMIVGIIIGMIISFKAMIRYNKGIF